MVLLSLLPWPDWQGLVFLLVGNVGSSWSISLPHNFCSLPAEPWLKFVTMPNCKKHLQDTRSGGWTVKVCAIQRSCKHGMQPRPMFMHFSRSSSRFHNCCVQHLPIASLRFADLLSTSQTTRDFEARPRPSTFRDWLF